MQRLHLVSGLYLLDVGQVGWIEKLGATDDGDNSVSAGNAFVMFLGTSPFHSGPAMRYVPHHCPWCGSRCTRS